MEDKLTTAQELYYWTPHDTLFTQREREREIASPDQILALPSAAQEDGLKSGAHFSPHQNNCTIVVTVSSFL